MTFGLIGAGLATADDDGLMPAAAYRRFAGEPPTDPTTDILTSTASFTYQSGTGSCRPVDVVSFEDAGRATQQPNARKGEP